MKLGASDRDEEVREIQEAAQKMAERMNMRFVVNEDKVRRFRDAASQDVSEVEDRSDYKMSHSNENVLNK